MRWFLVVFSLVLLAGSVLAQSGRGHGGGKRSGGSSPAQQQDDPTKLLATFDGTLKGVGSHSLTIQEENDNTVEFLVSKKTAFYNGDTKIKASDLKPGDRLTIEARRDIDGSLDAVNVRKAK
jgi:hypothetical protein